MIEHLISSILVFAILYIATYWNDADWFIFVANKYPFDSNRKRDLGSKQLLIMP